MAGNSIDSKAAFPDGGGVGGGGTWLVGGCAGGDVGLRVGALVGLRVGALVGLRVGALVGLRVGALRRRSPQLDGGVEVSICTCSIPSLIGRRAYI